MAYDGKLKITQATREAGADYPASVTDDGQTYGAFRRGEEDYHPLLKPSLVTAPRPPRRWLRLWRQSKAIQSKTV